MDVPSAKIARHKTAIRRNDFSLPVKCLLRDGVISTATTVFDYGCGHGENVERLRDVGISCHGWDPELRPHQPRALADVVNLGYVINVIEDPHERSATLRDAWKFAGKLLAVAAQVRVKGRGKTAIDFGDGIVTRIGTFQKYYSQGELREYLQSELGTDAIPAALGVFYLFKDESLKQQFIADRYRRRSAAPRKRVSELRFEENREVLEPLMSCIAELGRLPHADEFEAAAVVVERLGSLRRAFSLVKRVTGDDEWDAIRASRIEDLLVYLALTRFRKRPRLGALPLSLQRDIRDFFGTYQKACQRADELLFRAGDADSVDAACRRSQIGKLLPNALYVHESAMPSLEPLLRIYEGCARAYLGEIADTNIVKLHRYSGKVSYLAYPDFETDPHPVLLRSVKLNLRTLDLDCFDYAEADNPPILHRKEMFIRTDHPLHQKFARLTRQEEERGVLTDTASIGTRNGWKLRLKDTGFTLRGHRLIHCNGRS